MFMMYLCAIKIESELSLLLFYKMLRAWTPLPLERLDNVFLFDDTRLLDALQV
jgi:hypothetical protein